MAFITHLETTRPNYRRLFKLAIRMFLLPLIVVAITPVVIVMLARLPPQGQAVFAYIGGAFAAIPAILARMTRVIKDKRFYGASSVSAIILIMLVMLGVVPILIFILFWPFRIGIIEVSFAFLVGAICFIGFHEAGWRIGRALTKWWHEREHLQWWRAHDTRHQK